MDNLGYSNLNQKSNQMEQQQIASVEYLRSQEALRLAAEKALTNSCSWGWGEGSGTAEFFSPAERPQVMDPLSGLMVDTAGSLGSLGSLDCLISATNSNTDTSVEDDDISSILFSANNQTPIFFSSGLISENQPKAKKPRLENSRPSSSNINFHQPDHSSKRDEEPDSEAIAQMKEMIYRAAAFRPLNTGELDTGEKPKRKNVRISSDPQTVAARQRRERISEKIRVLQKLVPGGNKMDTASMLDEAANYLKFLRSQVKALESLGPITSQFYPFPSHSLLPFNHSFPMQITNNFSYKFNHS